MSIFFNVKEITHISGECKSGTGGILSYNINISLTWGLKRGFPFSEVRRVLRMHTKNPRHPSKGTIGFPSEEHKCEAFCSA
jgi:hypothetical protein